MDNPLAHLPPQDSRSAARHAPLPAPPIVGQVPPKATEQSEESQPDPIAALNLRFRELYAVNREELLASTPLAAVMLIGTGEVWRVEFGQPVRSYPSLHWIAHAKGLLHGVIAAQATAARLWRGRNLPAAHADVDRLAGALAQGQALLEGAIPPSIAPAARHILGTLQKLAAGWTTGRPAAPGDLTTALQNVQQDLQLVLTAVGEAVYESVAAGLRQLAAESQPDVWNHCLVGVCGVGFARRDNIEIAAAMSVMGRDAVGTRLLYLENAFTIEAGILQIGAALADMALGTDAFGDPYRMWRDLLGDVAAARAGGGFFPEIGRAADPS